MDEPEFIKYWWGGLLNTEKKNLKVKLIIICGVYLKLYYTPPADYIKSWALFNHKSLGWQHFGNKFALTWFIWKPGTIIVQVKVC